MKTKSIFHLLLLLVLSHVSIAQTFSPSITSPAGSFNSNSGYTFSQTIGEMTMVQTFSSGSSILTQGMQQPASAPVSVREFQNPLYSMEIFPNPGSGNFFIELKTPIAAIVRLRVLDILGQLVLTEKENNIPGTMRQTLNLSGLTNGTYMVQVILSDAAGKETFRKTQQVHIIK